MITLLAAARYYVMTTLATYSRSFTLIKNAAKHKFESVSFVFVACFSMDVIRGKRRISNAFIS